MTNFSVFAFLWAFSALLDLATADAWLRSPAHLLLPAMAIWVLLRARSVWAFLCFTLTLVATLVYDSPDTANHELLFLVAGSAILLAWLQTARRAGSPRHVDATDWLDAFAPVLRTLAIALYFFAVFHKLNREYFDPAASCAVHLFSIVEAELGFPLVPDGPAVRTAMVYGSLTIETLIPLSLIARRTRPLGLVAGVLFHTLLGMNFYAFSTGLFAFYALFVPRAVLDGAAGSVRALARRYEVDRLLPYAAPALALVISCGLTLAWPLFQQPETRDAATALARVLRFLWAFGMVSGVAGLLLFGEARRHWGEAAPGRALPRGVGWLFPAVVLLTGFSPYLGLRTAPAFSMFSNLRTENGASNHLIVPASSFEIAGYQRDVVSVETTNAPALDSFRKRRLRLVYFDFKQRLQQAVAQRALDARPLRVSYWRDGRRYFVPDVAKDPVLMEPIPWLQRKLLRFRPVPIRGPLCTW